MARRSGESWDSMRIDIGNFSSDLGGATTESSLKKILNQVRQNTDATIREAKTFIDTETGRVIQEIFAPRGTFGSALQTSVQSLLQNTRNFPDPSQAPNVTFGTANVSMGTRTFHGPQAQAKAAFEAQQAGGFVNNITGDSYQYAIPNALANDTFKQSSNLSRRFKANTKNPFEDFLDFQGGTPNIDDFSRGQIMVRGEEALTRARGEAKMFGGYIGRDDVNGMRDFLIPKGMKEASVFKGTKEASDRAILEEKNELGLLDAKTPSQRGFIDKAIASFTSIHILTSTAKSILSAVMSLGTRSYTEQREALALGLTPSEYRNYSYLETAKGLGEGTFTGAMGDIQNAFGNITNLDQGALESLALVMGGQVAELVNSGMGGKDPEALMKAILDAFASRAAQGRNSVGQYVGQEDAIRELSSYLGDFSKDMETIFLSMWQDRNRMGVTGTPTFAGYTNTSLDVGMNGGLLLDTQELGRTLNEFNSSMRSMLDSVFAGFAANLDSFLRMLSTTFGGIVFSSLGAEDKKNIAVDTFKVAEENYKTLGAYQEGAEGRVKLATGVSFDSMFGNKKGGKEGGAAYSSLIKALRARYLAARSGNKTAVAGIDGMFVPGYFGAGGQGNAVLSNLEEYAASLGISMEQLFDEELIPQATVLDDIKKSQESFKEAQKLYNEAEGTNFREGDWGGIRANSINTGDLTQAVALADNTLKRNNTNATYLGMEAAVEAMFYNQVKALESKHGFAFTENRLESAYGSYNESGEFVVKLKLEDPRGREIEETLYTNTGVNVGNGQFTYDVGLGEIVER